MGWGGGEGEEGESHFLIVATAHTFQKNLIQFLVIPWPVGKWRKCKHRRDRIYGERVSRITVTSKDNLYHSVIKGLPLAILLLPWQMSAALVATVSFYPLYYSSKGEGKRSRRKAEKKGSEGRKANSSLDFLKTFVAATSCPHCFFT